MWNYLKLKFMSIFVVVQSLSHVCLCNPMDCSMPGFLSINISWSLPKLMFIELVHWCHLTISSSVSPFSFCFPSIRLFSNEFFISGGLSTRASVSASVLPMNIRGWFLLRWTGLIALQSKDSQESSPTPQFKSINSSALSLLHSPTLTSIHDCWKNHSLD